ncbi:hypothetical protein EJB05_25954, partial [Eragrostis curvula]
LSNAKFTHTLAHAPAQLTVQLSGHQHTTTASLLNATRAANAAARVEHARCEGLAVPVHVDVRNVGDRDGAHTVLVYHAAPPAVAAGEEGAPVRQLVAFEKVHVPAGGVARVEMSLDVCEELSRCLFLSLQRQRWKSIKLERHRITQIIEVYANDY